MELDTVKEKVKQNIDYLQVLAALAIFEGELQYLGNNIATHPHSVSDWIIRTSGVVAGGGLLLNGGFNLAQRAENAAQKWVEKKWPH